VRPPERWPRLGTFALPEGEIVGELVLDGSNTSLHLHHDRFFDSRTVQGTILTGRLNDGTRVTLIDCLSPGTGSRLGGPYFADIHPHYVAYGGTHLDPNAKCISQITFEIDDATTLFYDFDAFGTVTDAVALMPQVEAAQRASLSRHFPDAIPRPIPTGPNCIISYFAGRTTIISGEAALGTVTASHNPTYSAGGPSGVSIANKITITVGFDESIRFEESLTRLHAFLRFFDLLIGRPQNLLGLTLHLSVDSKDAAPLHLYWCSPPGRAETQGTRNPHPADVLLSPIEHPQAFREVLCKWMDRETAWQDARERFSTCFRNQNVYDIDRLLGAANMFDILPSSAEPREITLAADLMDAKQRCREIFQALSVTPERDSVLSALGRVGKSSLKRKIRHRAEPIVSALGSSFPHLVDVLDEAVNCRNHYVHGSSGSYDYVNNFFTTAVFFTKTLEFVFGASDLAESGWDMIAWSKQGSSGSHPFGEFAIEYRDHLEALQRLTRIGGNSDVGQ
jgi:hypothetical protein